MIIITFTDDTTEMIADRRDLKHKIRMSNKKVRGYKFIK